MRLPSATDALAELTTVVLGARPEPRCGDTVAGAWWRARVLRPLTVFAPRVVQQFGANSKEVLAVRKCLTPILAACAVALAPMATASAAVPPQPASVRTDTDVLRQLVRLLDTGSVTICPGQAMGSFGCSCPPGICL